MINLDKPIAKHAIIDNDLAVIQPIDKCKITDLCISEGAVAVTFAYGSQSDSGRFFRCWDIPVKHISVFKRDYPDDWERLGLDDITQLKWDDFIAWLTQMICVKFISNNEWK